MSNGWHRLDGIFLIRSGSNARTAARVWIAVAAVSVAAAVWLAAQPGQLGDLRLVRTWLAYWVQQGRDPYAHFGDDLDYPPIAFFVLWPLSHFAEASLTVWFPPFAVVSMVAAAWWTLRWIGDRMHVDLSAPQRVALVAMMLAGAGARRTIYLGQTVGLSVLFGALALRWMRSRPVAAAAALALCSFKPHVAVGFGLAVLLIAGPRVPAIAGAFVALATMLFAATVNVPVVDVVRRYAAHLLSLYEGETHIQGLLSVRVVLESFVTEYARSAVILTTSAAAALLLIVVLSRRRRTDAVTEVQVAVACLMWSILFLPHQRYNSLLVWPAVWLAMWPEGAVVARRALRMTIVVAYVMFSVLDVPLIVRAIWLLQPDRLWLFDLSYYLPPLRMAAVFALIVAALYRRPSATPRRDAPPGRVTLATDPYLLAGVAAWISVAAFYLAPGVPPAMLERLGDYYTTLPLWPWVIAACLTRLASAGEPRRLGAWRLLAASFACLLLSEIVLGLSDGFTAEVVAQFLYVGFYALQAAVATPAFSSPGRVRVRRSAVAACLTVLTASTLMAFESTAGHSRYWLTSGAYLVLDLALAGLFILRGRSESDGRWRTAYVGLAASALLFGVTDALNVLHYARLMRLPAGGLSDLIWTLPPMCYLFTIRAARLALAAGPVSTARPSTAAAR